MPSNTAKYLTPELDPYVRKPREFGPDTCTEPVLGSAEWYETATGDDLVAYRQIYRTLPNERVLTRAGLHLVADWMKHELVWRQHCRAPWVSAHAQRERVDNGKGRMCSRYTAIVIGGADIVPAVADGAEGYRALFGRPITAASPAPTRLDIGHEKTQREAIGTAQHWATIFALGYIIRARRAQVLELEDKRRQR